MNYLTLVLMALALSMDACAVSMARGMAAQRRRGLDGLLTALSFGAAQAAMPVLGFVGGSRLANEALRAGGELLAAFILALLGLKMLLESGQGEETRPQRGRGGYLRCLLVQAVATSIDALAVGVGICGMGGGIWLPAAVIGAVTAAVCGVGFALGAALGSGDCRTTQRMGGAILLLLALHTLFG